MLFTPNGGLVFFGSDDYGFCHCQKTYSLKRKPIHRTSLAKPRSFWMGLPRRSLPTTNGGGNSRYLQDSKRIN